METEFLFQVLGLIMTMVAAILAGELIAKAAKLRQIESSVGKLKQDLDEMDEQAKLVVRTDLELNKAQEELDKKVTGLYTLQQLSRAISISLEESQIFQSISPEDLSDLGFEKAVAFLWREKEKRFGMCLAIGYNEDEISVIRYFVEASKDMYLTLISERKTLSSLTLTNDMAKKEKIIQNFKIQSFVICPILPQEGNKGFLFVGTENDETPLTEGDEELITILATQLGQALENARLFETTWKAHQELEKKVEERTRELTLALEEVKKVNKRKTDFVSAVSHELRTPMTSVKGYASILLDSSKLGEVPPAVRERLEKINRHSDELIHMINDLLDISRLESGRMTMKMDTYELKMIVDGIAELLSVQAKNKGLNLIVNIDPQLKVVVDKRQIERVFTNLIGNALKFTPEGGSITVSSKPAKDFLQVDISDTGCGIPKEAHESIFEEFYRVDNLINQEVKGTGLGLSLVKNIVEAHRGIIWVESEVGKGTTFSFLLPESKPIPPA